MLAELLLATYTLTDVTPDPDFDEFRRERAAEHQRDQRRIRRQRSHEDGVKAWARPRFIAYGVFLGLGVTVGAFGAARYANEGTAPALLSIGGVLSTVGFVGLVVTGSIRSAELQIGSAKMSLGPGALRLRF